MPTGKKIEKEMTDDELDKLVHKITDVVDDYQNLDGVDDWESMVESIKSVIKEAYNETN